MAVHIIPPIVSFISKEAFMPVGAVHSKESVNLLMQNFELLTSFLWDDNRILTLVFE